MRMLTAKVQLGLYGATVSAWTAPGYREVNMTYCEYGREPLGVDTYKVDFPVTTTEQLVREIDRNWFIDKGDKITENF